MTYIFDGKGFYLSAWVEPPSGPPSYMSGFLPSPGSQLAKNVSTSAQYLSTEQNPDLPQRDNAPNPSPLLYDVIFWIHIQCNTGLWYVISCHVMSRCITSRHVTIRYVTLRHVTLRYVMLRNVMLWYVMLPNHHFLNFIYYMLCLDLLKNLCCSHMCGVTQKGP